MWTKFSKVEGYVEAEMQDAHGNKASHCICQGLLTFKNKPSLSPADEPRAHNFHPQFSPVIVLAIDQWSLIGIFATSVKQYVCHLGPYIYSTWEPQAYLETKDLPYFKDCIPSTFDIQSGNQCQNPSLCKQEANASSDLLIHIRGSFTLLSKISDRFEGWRLTLEVNLSKSPYLFQPPSYCYQTGAPSSPAKLYPGFKHDTPLNPAKLCPALSTKRRCLILRV